MKFHNFFKTLCALLLFGCDKKVSFDLEENSPSVVVEATIENGEAPRVVLTRSFNFFSTFSPKLLEESFVHDAEINISNGVLNHTLKEYRVGLAGGFSFYYYSIDSTQLSTAFKGELDHSYALNIKADHKEYTATTTIPPIKKQIDSIWWKPAPEIADSSDVVVLIKVTDPPGYGSYIRYFTKRNNEPFYPALNSVFDDLVVDGTTYNIAVEPGVDRNKERDSDKGNFFQRGDTVTLKMSDIDKATFDFWRTMEYNYSSIGNPFSSPIVVLGNISNGALGYFGGYASQYHTLIIPQ